LKKLLSKIMDEHDTCPLCCEDFDATDKGFNPCHCGYKICLWCFSKIVEGRNPKCPACRADYSKDKLKATPDASVIRASKEEMQRKKREKQIAKDTRPKASTRHSSSGLLCAVAARKSGSASRVRVPVAARAPVPKRLSLKPTNTKLAPNQRDVERLGNARVKQPNLGLKGMIHPGKKPVVQLPPPTTRPRDPNTVYVVGLPSTVNVRNMFGNFGRIVKVVKNFRGSAYITYETSAQAQAAIKALNGRIVENGRSLRCVRGTTKYCTYFLRNQECLNPSCLYLHAFSPEDEETSARPPLRPTGVHAFNDSGPLPVSSSALSQQDPSMAMPSMRRYQSQPTSTARRRERSPGMRGFDFSFDSKGLAPQRSPPPVPARPKPLPSHHALPSALARTSSAPLQAREVGRVPPPPEARKPTLPAVLQPSPSPATANLASALNSRPNGRHTNPVPPIGRVPSEPRPAVATPSAPPGLHKNTVNGPIPSPVASSSLPPGLSQPAAPSSPASTLSHQSKGFNAMHYFNGGGSGDSKAQSQSQEQSPSKLYELTPSTQNRLEVSGVFNAGAYWSSELPAEGSTGGSSSTRGSATRFLSSRTQENCIAPESLDQFFEQLTSGNIKTGTLAKPKQESTSASFEMLIKNGSGTRTQSRFTFAR